MEAERKEYLKKESLRYSMLVVACILYATAINFFLYSNNIITGGVAGIATMLDKVIPGISVLGLFILVLNIPILLIGLLKFGWKFISRCLLTIFLSSMLSEAFLIPVDFVATEYIQGLLFKALTNGTFLFLTVLLLFILGLIRTLSNKEKKDKHKKTIIFLIIDFLLIAIIIFLIIYFHRIFFRRTEENKGYVTFTNNPLIAAVVGGIIKGFAIGLFIKFKISSGGTELLGREFNSWFKFFSISTWIAIFDAIIVIASAIVLGMHDTHGVSGMEVLYNILAIIFYSLVQILVATKTTDLVLMGISQSYLCQIITTKEAEMNEYLVTHCHRGITVMQGIGGYTHLPKAVLVVCVHSAQLETIKSAIKNCDPEAFVIISKANDVIGKGFKNLIDKY